MNDNFIIQLILHFDQRKGRMKAMWRKERITSGEGMAESNRCSNQRVIRKYLYLFEETGLESRNKWEFFSNLKWMVFLNKTIRIS